MANSTNQAKSAVVLQFSSGLNVVKAFSLFQSTVALHLNLSSVKMMWAALPLKGGMWWERHIQGQPTSSSQKISLSARQLFTGKKLKVLAKFKPKLNCKATAALA